MSASKTRYHDHTPALTRTLKAEDDKIIMTLQEETRTAPCALAQRIGLRMRQERKRQGFTLAKIAARCGTTPQTICRLETAGMTISLEWIEKVADSLDIEPDVFFNTTASEHRAALLKLQGARAAATAIKIHVDEFLDNTEQMK